MSVVIMNRSRIHIGKEFSSLSSFDTGSLKWWGVPYFCHTFFNLESITNEIHDIFILGTVFSCCTTGYIHKPDHTFPSILYSTSSQ
jgi:hypothetical protein